MQNYSTATVEGYVTHSPVIKRTKTGKALCTFSLAVNHYSRSDAEPKVSYVEIESWEKVADICTNNVVKGKRVMVIGSLRQDKWQGKDGKSQSRMKVVANEVRFIEPLKKKEEQTAAA